MHVQEKRLTVEDYRLGSHPDERLVQVYRGSVEHVTGVGIDGVLDGDNVLPGFTLSLNTVFASIDKLNSRSRTS